MAQLYTNENFALQVVLELRLLGHGVLTSLDAGNANCAIPDEEVVKFATEQYRILLTYNRRDFLLLHHHRASDHLGIFICTFDPDFVGQAKRIHAVLESKTETKNHLFRVNKPG